MQILKLALGFIALIFAFIGIFLPILPTTPFVLVSVSCFSAHPKIRRKILNISFFNEYYLSYVEKRPLKVQTLVFSLCFLWAMLILSAVLVDKFYICVILGFVGICVSIHIIIISRIFNKTL